MTSPLEPQSLTISGVEVLFPYKPYDIQLDYMKSIIHCCQQKVNGLLESPTGTGKTLCILCSAMAWIRTFEPKMRQLMVTDEEGLQQEVVVSDDRHIPRILYSSRTHSQLSQCCQQLKRTHYKTERAVVIASREQLCLRPDVRSLSGTTQQSMKCSQLTKDHKCAYFEGFDQKVKSSQLLPEVDQYYASRDDDCKVMDIEDLMDFGRRHTCCPYYSAREMARKASVVFTPYTYLLDPELRGNNKSKGISLKDSVVVFDEGHNMEKEFEERMSTQLTTHMMDASLKRIDFIAIQLQTTPADRLPEEFEGLKIAKLLELETCLQDLRRGIAMKFVSNRVFKPETKALFDLLDESGLEFKEMGKWIKLLEDICDIRVDTGAGNTQTNGDPFWCLKLMRDFLCKIYPKSVSIETLDEYKREFCDKYRLYVESDNTTNDWVFNVWCMSASVGAKALLAEDINCLIITSGTLAPIDSFDLEMGVKFDVKLQNSHIIGDNQLSIINIHHSKNKTVLTSKYDNRDNMEYYRALGQTLIEILKAVPKGVLVFFSALGQTLIEILRAVPKGVLVFFSSYTALNKCTQIWKQYRNDNIWDKLNAVKQIFLEPRSKHAFNECFVKYKQKVDENQSSGAVFFGVFRGKLSEGIDLPDDYCRGVILTGLPFPAVMDPRVILKKQYLNEAKIGLSADGWYALQMKRALNQAIGRVVRHKDDFGVIILLDSRFASLSDEIEVIFYESKLEFLLTIDGTTGCAHKCQLF
ncbi:unnamed protein product [Oppiella nova]|uniref:Helicase ATP-binding domain-containing protein n=1 Tax=Oppiella nova TaxID=334625 RepID=A0A7R9QDI1_9ACAR|nr:unnamed protein product [Oppiella nova]CAG2163144.1 unnamed protein product [Oppiella nova]